MDGTTICKGLHLPECPRWRDGALWFSDMWGHQVHRLGPDGTDEVVLELDDDDPGGLGWLPDGDLLVVGMEHAKLWRWDGTSLSLHADLRPYAAWPCNDMTVADDGTAYVTQFGFDSWHGTTGRLASSILEVAPDGSVSVAAPELFCPNGIAFDAEERLLFVAEPAAMRITRFTRSTDGALGDRVEFAQLPQAEGAPYAPPDGLCVDADGGVWAADPIGGQVVHLDRDGLVTQVIDHPQHALACTLGGDDGRTLFVCSAGEHHKPTRSGEATGRIDAYRVEVPGSRRLP
jgi:sugar lactone lactonase YvrE